MITFADRLKRAMAHRESETGERILKKEIAAAAGVTSSAVTLWIQGKTHNLKADPIMKLAKYLRVRIEWLKDGKGPMVEAPAGAADPAASQPEVVRRPIELSKDADALIELIAQNDRNGSLSRETLRALRVIVSASAAEPRAAAADPLKEAHARAEQQVAAKQPRQRQKKSAA